MADFSAFTEPTPTNSFIIQRALRQVDTAVLATAMIGLEDVYQEMIKRNISQRVTRIIEEEIELKQGAIREEQIEEARALFLELLVQAQDRTDPHEVREHAKPPQIKLGSHEDIVDTFHALARYVRRCGNLSLQETEDQINDPLMRKGVQYLVDGVEHMLMHSLLEKYKQTLLRDMETRYDMILDGIETLGSGYTPEMVKEKLKTHIPA